MPEPAKGSAALQPCPIHDAQQGELHISWEQYHRLIEHLALQIHQAKAPFDQIVGLSRGGLRVGDALSRVFERPLVVMAASSYSGNHDRSQGELKLGGQLAHTCPKLGPRLLLVDDLADSGTTLSAAERWLTEHIPDVSVQTAVLWQKACSKVVPCFKAMELPNNPWVIQPFERWGSIKPHQLQPMDEWPGPRSD